MPCLNEAETLESCIRKAQRALLEASIAGEIIVADNGSRKREAEAEKCYRAAMSLDESYAMARYNLSYLLLRQGRFEEGWYCLEARNWYTAWAARLQCPRWQGESLVGKSVLIGYEPGHGDLIQYCRYAGSAKGAGCSRDHLDLSSGFERIAVFG